MTSEVQRCLPILGIIFLCAKKHISDRFSDITQIMQQFSRNRDAKRCKHKVCGSHFYKQTLAWGQASGEFACFQL